MCDSMMISRAIQRWFHMWLNYDFACDLMISRAIQWRFHMRFNDDFACGSMMILRAIQWWFHVQFNDDFTCYSMMISRIVTGDELRILFIYYPNTERRHYRDSASKLLRNARISVLELNTIFKKFSGSVPLILEHIYCIFSEHPRRRDFNSVSSESKRNGGLPLHSVEWYSSIGQ